eukprot:TRINITY_DN18481_c0_g1_i1.p1 TRINITY_DN18481_c0_g1~~TRINITY_DN18481_c0_g1_i1.p1  ORF type:complete len:183 (-),score=51.04 TRINITY_DN18481_c0_g1_i1:227-775(-)
MARKKIRVTRENHKLKTLKDEDAAEKKRQERIDRRKELRNDMKKDLMKKLSKVKAQVDGTEEAPEPKDGKKSSGDDDVEMGSSSSKRVKVIKSIQKLKKKPLSAKLQKGDKRLLQVAKEQGVIKSVKMAKLLLEGKKKNTSKPDGRERARDKRIRVRKEKRERKGVSKPEDWEPEEDSDFSA